MDKLPCVLWQPSLTSWGTALYALQDVEIWLPHLLTHIQLLNDDISDKVVWLSARLREAVMIEGILKPIRDYLKEFGVSVVWD